MITFSSMFFDLANFYTYYPLRRIAYKHTLLVGGEFINYDFLINFTITLLST